MTVKTNWKSRRLSERKWEYNNHKIKRHPFLGVLFLKLNNDRIKVVVIFNDQWSIFNQLSNCLIFKIENLLEIVN